MSEQAFWVVNIQQVVSVYLVRQGKCYFRCIKFEALSLACIELSSSSILYLNGVFIDNVSVIWLDSV